MPKRNSYISVNSSDVSYNQFPSSTFSFPQDLENDLSIVSEELEALVKTIDQNLQYIIRDPPKVSTSIETQTDAVSSGKYADPGVGINNDLFVTVKYKGTETDSECHQLIGTLRKTVSLLKNELRNKQVTIDNLVDVTNNFTVNEIKYTGNKEQETNVCSKGDNDVVDQLLEIDKIHHRFQKLTDQPQSSTDTPTTSIIINKNHIEENHDELELTNNVEDKKINDYINESSKISITTNRDCSNNDNNASSDIFNNIIILVIAYLS